MAKRLISVILCLCIILSFSIIFVGCGGTNSGEFPVVIGETTIKSEPKNIVVLSDNLADIISYIGYDVKMVGRSAETDQEFLAIVPSVGLSTNPSVDLITEYETDLVIADDKLPEDIKAQLVEKNITVLQLKYATTTEELQTLYSDLGAALGGNKTGRQKGEDAYDELIGTLDSFKDSVSRSVIITACYLYLNENKELCTFTKDSIEAKLLSYCAITNVFSDQETEKVDTAKLKMSTPTYIFYADDFTLQALTNDENLQNLSAIKNEHTKLIPLKNFKRQGTTYEETVFTIMDTIYVKDVETPNEASTMASTTSTIETKGTEAATENVVEEVEEEMEEIVGGDV